MIIIKNYYTQLSELRIAEARLETLEEKKTLLEAQATKTTGTLKEVVSFGNVSNSKMTDYVIKCEKINKEIEEVTEEIKILKKGLQRMEEILEDISGIEERIFRLYFMENKTITQIARIIPCDRSTVYRYKDKIEEKYEAKRL